MRLRQLRPPQRPREHPGVIDRLQRLAVRYHRAAALERRVAVALLLRSRFTPTKTLENDRAKRTFNFVFPI